MKPLVLLCALVAAATTAGATSSASRGGPSGHGAGAWAPGRTGSLDAMERLPVATDVPQPVAAAARRGAAATGGDPAQALATLRLLESGLGATGADLYAFRTDDSGAVCFVLWRRGGACPGPISNTPGVEFILAGAYPGAEVGGRQVDAPSALVGIASDAVASLSLAIGGETRRVPIRNDGFFAEVPDPRAGTAWDVTLTVSYADGTTRSVAIPDPRAD